MTIGIYAFFAIISRTAMVSEYYVAGRKVPAETKVLPLRPEGEENLLELLQNSG